MHRNARADNDSRIPTITANGIQLYSERDGSGPRLLFLNGSGSTLATSALLIAPVANSEAIATLVPDAELRLYEGGHAFFAQDSRALPDIFAFLADDLERAPS